MDVIGIRLGKIFNNIKSKVFILFNYTKREKKFFSFLLVIFILVVIGLVFPSSSAHAFWDEVASGILGHVIYPLVYVIFYILFYIAYIIAWLGAVLVSANLNPELMNSVLTSPGIEQGWKIFRDIANLLFILILLLVAFGTIFRSDTYNAKKSLPTLIIVAFLINFSAMITGVVIDFTNILMYGILKMMCAGNDQCLQDFTGMLFKSINDLKDMHPLAGSVKGFISWEGISVQSVVSMAIAAIYTFIYGLVLVALAVFLLIRIAALAILIILSPLAFFGQVAPGLKGISNKWWDNLLQYAFFGPIFALLLYVTGLMASTTFTIGSTLISQNLELGAFTSLLATIIANIIPLIFLLAIIPITKSMGIAGADAVMKNTVGLAGKVGSFAGNAADRYLARGAGMKGSEEKSLKGSLSRAHAWTRNKLSYTSPGAIKRAYKATVAEQEHDYDRAAGRMRDTYSSTVEGQKTHHEDVANRNEVARKVKDLATKDGDEIVDMFQDAKNITDQQVLLRMAAEEGKSYKLASTQKNAAGINYTEDAEGYNRFYNEKIKPRMSESEAAKLGGDIGDLEDKKGNKGLIDLGHYNTARRKWSTRDYSVPGEKAAHRNDIVESLNRGNVLSTMKDLRASSFITNHPGIGVVWNEVGTGSASYFTSTQGLLHIDKIKPKEKAIMKTALANKALNPGLYGPLSGDELTIQANL